MGKDRSFADKLRSIYSGGTDGSSAMDEDELRESLRKSKEEGLLNELEFRMIRSVLELDDTTVKEILVPQPDIESIPSDMLLSNIPEYISDKTHTRYPVVEDNQEKVIGYIDVKDIVSMRSDDTVEEMKAKDVVRDIPIFPETTRVDELLVSLQEDNKQMAAVIDEWGSLEGIVTIEDIIEVIVGEIRDDFDDPTEEPKIQKTEGHYDVDGHVPIRRFNRVLGTEYTVEDGAETVAGLILSEVGEVPDEDDEIQIGEIQFVIDTVSDNRISKIEVSRNNGRPESQ